MNERVRIVSWVLAVLFAAVVSAIAVGAAGCSSSNASPAGPGSGSGGAGSPTANRNMGAGGAAGSNAGGTGGAAGAGTDGGAVGGAAGMGCPQPTGPVGTWVEIAPPAGQSNFRVTDAFAVGTNDILFAGNTSDPTFAAPAAGARVLRWNQGCWTVEVMIPSSASTPDFVSVHGTGPNDLWVVGSDLVYHRDAQGWTRFSDESWRNTIRLSPFSPTQLVPVQLRRIRAAGAGDVWVAATSNVMHWNGQWTTYNFDDADYPNASASVGFDFYDIWIDAPNNVWVVGPIDQVGNTMEPGGTHHFDGAGWTHTSIGVFPIYGIWRGGSVLWLAQPTLADVNGRTESLTLRAYDGTNPNAPAVEIAGVDPTQRSVAMTNLFGRGAGDIWAAGDDVAHFDGQGWSLVADAPAPTHGSNDFRNTVVTGDAGSIWLVTAGPHFFRKANGP